jgi:hypothetical protein
LLWIGTDADGFRTVSCMAEAPDCERCGGTDDDPADPEWACETGDGDGIVSTSLHVPADYDGPAEAVA